MPDLELLPGSYDLPGARLRAGMTVELRGMIDHSYELVVKSLPKAQRAKL